MKRSLENKATFEDKFSRMYACWVKNNPKAWAWFKKQNRKSFRRYLKKELDKTIQEDYN